MCRGSSEQGCVTQHFPINIPSCPCSNPHKTPLVQQEVALVPRAAAGWAVCPCLQVAEQCCPLCPAMRLPVLCALVTLLSLSRCRAVSFPEDEDPINVVDYHCEWPARADEQQGKSSKKSWFYFFPCPHHGKLKKKKNLIPFKLKCVFWLCIFNRTLNHFLKKAIRNTAITSGKRTFADISHLSLIYIQDITQGI